VAFAKLSILDKFQFVLKIFIIMNSLKSGGDTSGYRLNGNILRCIEMILAEKKVLNYIDWQEKNPQMMIVLKTHVRQMFKPQE